MNWDKEIKELKSFFLSENIILPKKIVLNNFTTIIESQLFVTAHLQMIEQYNGSPLFLSYLERLIELKSVIEKTK